jgi:hypothetical protein
MFRRVTWLGVGLIAGATVSQWAERRLRKQLERYLPANQLKAGAEAASRVRLRAAGKVADLRVALEGGHSAMVVREAELRRQFRLPDDGALSLDGEAGPPTGARR